MTRSQKDSLPIFSYAIMERWIPSCMYFLYRIHKRTTSLRFLGIILSVLRLEVSVYNVYIKKKFSNHFCSKEGGVKRWLWIARRTILTIHKTFVPISSKNSASVDMAYCTFLIIPTNVFIPAWMHAKTGIHAEAHQSKEPGVGSRRIFS
jgi:hypothetical protein